MSNRGLKSLHTTLGTILKLKNSKILCFFCFFFGISEWIQSTPKRCWSHMTGHTPQTTEGLWSEKTCRYRLVISNVSYVSCSFFCFNPLLSSFTYRLACRWRRRQNELTWRSWRPASRSCFSTKCCCLRTSSTTTESPCSVSKLWVFCMKPVKQVCPAPLHQSTDDPFWCFFAPLTVKGDALQAVREKKKQSKMASDDHDERKKKKTAMQSFHIKGWFLQYRRRI